MQFYLYSLGFLVLGVMFSSSEYVVINYPIRLDSNDFDTAYLISMGVIPFLLIFVLVALAFMVSEILRPGITLSTPYRDFLLFISGGFAAAVSICIMSYNNDHCFES